MLKIDSRITTVTPLWMIVGALFFLAVRIVLSFVEFSHPPKPTVEIAWSKPTPISKDSNPDGKPLLFYFTAAWCGACKNLERGAFSNKQVVAMINESFVPIQVVDRSVEDKLNTPLVRELEYQYGASVYPEIVVALPDGMSVNENLGEAKPFMIRAFLSKSLELLPNSRGRDFMVKGDFKKAAANFETYLNQAGWDTLKSPYAAMRICVCLRLLGQNADSAKWLEKARQQISSKQWPYAFLDYLAGSLSYDELAKKAGELKGNMVEYHAYAGLCAYASGQKAQAKKDLEFAASDPYYKDWIEYQIAKDFLTRIAIEDPHSHRPNRLARPGSQAAPTPGASDYTSTDSVLENDKSQ